MKTLDDLLAKATPLPLQVGTGLGRSYELVKVFAAFQKAKLGTLLCVANCDQQLLDKEEQISNACLIVAAVNNMPALVAALEAATSHMAELWDAWERGIINESDGKGGARSNRNVDTFVMAEKAYAALRKDLEKKP